MERLVEERQLREDEKKLLKGAGVYLCTIVLLAGGGLLAGSLQLLADAGHAFTDFVSLLVAKRAKKHARKPASDTHTYGYARTQVIADVINALTLIAIMGLVAYHAVKRLGEQSHTHGDIVAWTAAVSLMCIFAVLHILRPVKERQGVRGAYLHILTDGWMTLAVFCGGVTIHYTGWARVDAIMALCIAVISIWHAWNDVLKPSSAILMDAVPEGVDRRAVVQTIIQAVHAWAHIHNEDLEVVNVHDVHTRVLGDGQRSLQCHLVVSRDLLLSRSDELLREVRNALMRNHHIAHVTIQVVPGQVIVPLMRARVS